MSPVANTRFALAFFCLNEAHTISMPCLRNFEYETWAFHHSEFIMGLTTTSQDVRMADIIVDALSPTLGVKRIWESTEDYFQIEGYYYSSLVHTHFTSYQKNYR